jgi:hypothetical protein
VINPSNNGGTHLAATNGFTGPMTIDSGAVWADVACAIPAATPVTIRKGGDLRANCGAINGERLTVASIAGGGNAGIESASMSLNIGGDRMAGANGAITMTGGTLSPGDYPDFTDTLATGTLTLRDRGNAALNVYLSSSLAGGDGNDIALECTGASIHGTLLRLW